MSEYSQPILLAHRIVQQFLRVNGYDEALAAFQRDAAEVLTVAEPCLVAPTPLEELVLNEAASQHRDERTQRATRPMVLAGEVSLSDEEMICPSDPLPLTTTTLAESIEYPANIVTVQHVMHPVVTLVTSHTDRTIRFTAAPITKADNEIPHPIVVQTKSVVLSMDVHTSRPNWLLMSCMDGSVAILDIESHQLVAEWKAHTKYAVSARFVAQRSDGSIWVASIGHDGLLNVYRVKAEHNSPDAKTSGAVTWDLHRQQRFRTAAEALAILPTEDASADPEAIVALRSDPYLRYVNLASGAVRCFSVNEDPLSTHVSFSILDLAVSPCGRYIAAATDKEPLGYLAVYARAESRLVAGWYVGSVPAYARPSCKWLGRRVVAAFGDTQVYLLEFGLQSPRAAWTAHSAAVRALCVISVESTATTYLVTGGFDSSARLWPCQVGGDTALVTSDDSPDEVAPLE